MKRARSHRSSLATSHRRFHRARRFAVAAVGLSLLPLTGCGSLADTNVISVQGRRVTVDQFNDLRNMLDSTGTAAALLSSSGSTDPEDRQLVTALTNSLLLLAVADKLGIEVPSTPGADGKRPIEVELGEIALSADEDALTVGDLASRLDSGTRQIFWDFIAGLAYTQSQQSSPFAAATEEGFASLAAAAPDLAHQTCFETAAAAGPDRAETQRLIDAGKMASLPNFQQYRCLPNTALESSFADVATEFRVGTVGKISKPIPLPVDPAAAAQQPEAASARYVWIRNFGPRTLTPTELGQFLQGFANGSPVGFASLFAFENGWVDLNPEYGQLAYDANGGLIVRSELPETRSAPPGAG